jgi:hypothetical protein
MKALIAWIEQMGAKRFFALVLAPGLLVFGFDSYISHFWGHEESHKAQWVPVYYCTVATLLLVGAALPRIPPHWFRMILKVVGATCCLVGVAGVIFHVIPMVKDLSDEKFSYAAIQGAVASAPPLFAPGAFVMVGGLVWLLASQAVFIRLKLSGPVDTRVTADEEETQAATTPGVRVGLPRA